MLTNISGIHPLTALRPYNAGCEVEQRIEQVEELVQLSVGRTVVDDVDGNRPLSALGVLVYQLFKMLRHRLPGGWQRAQPNRLRT